MICLEMQKMQASSLNMLVVSIALKIVEPTTECLVLTEY